MNEDIRKWSDGRYTLMFDEHTFFVFDNEKEKRMTALKVTKKLNEQQATIHSLKEEVRLLKPTNIEQYEQIVQLQKENEQLINRLTFLNKVISFFADSPMTKYSSKSELLDEMRLLEKMRLI